MGLLRLLLACAVVISHSAPLYGFVGIGSHAVPAFFVISGFYTHLILSGPYRGQHGIRRFYLNRTLRLLPTYWMVLLVFAAVAASADTGNVIVDRIHFLARNAIGGATEANRAALVSALPNLLGIGADVTRLFCVSPATGHLVLDRTAGHLAGCRGLDRSLVLPQVWSLSVEILCYAAAPVLLRLRDRSFAAVLLVSVVLHEVTRHSGLVWYNLPFCFNAAYFLIGSAAFRIYGRNPALYRRSSWVLALVPFALFFFYGYVAVEDSPAVMWPLWSVYALCLPGLFDLTRDSAWDRAVGDLSYPMYLIHWLFAWAIGCYGTHGPASAILASALAAGLLVLVVERPVAVLRGRIAGRNGEGRAVRRVPDPLATPS